MRDHRKPCDWVRTELATVERIRCALLELSMDSFDCNRKSTDLTMIRLSISLPSKWHLEKELSRFNCSNLFLFLVGIVLQRPASLWYDVTICCFLYDLPLPSIGGNKLLIFFSHFLVLQNWLGIANVSATCLSACFAWIICQSLWENYSRKN